MHTPDFVTIQRSARRLHDEEVRRHFGNLARILSRALSRFGHSLHPAHPQGGPKRYA